MITITITMATDGKMWVKCGGKSPTKSLGNSGTDIILHRAALAGTELAIFAFQNTVGMVWCQIFMQYCAALFAAHQKP